MPVACARACADAFLANEADVPRQHSEPLRSNARDGSGGVARGNAAPVSVSFSPRPGTSRVMETGKRKFWVDESVDKRDRGGERSPERRQEMDSGAVIGAGAWGTALAKVLGDKGYPVRFWTRHPEHARLMAETRLNTRYLPGATLPASVVPTHSLPQALGGARLVLLVVPSHALRATLDAARPDIPEHAVLVSAPKGIEDDTLM